MTPTGASATSYSYNQAGELTGYTPPTGASYSYAYDGDGLRASKTTGSTTENFAYNLTTPTPLILTDTGNSYIYGPDDQPIEQISSNGTITYLHHDQLGSTRLITNNTGTTAATFSYSPYGKPNGSTGTATTPLGYAGQYTDPETGLYYMRARYYDPSTGQFISRDPLDAITQQPYSYAQDNPINGTDPSGACFIVSCSVYHYVSRHAEALGAIALGTAVGAAGIAGGVACAYFTEGLESFHCYELGALGLAAGGTIAGIGASELSTPPQPPPASSTPPQAPACLLGRIPALDAQLNP